MATTVQLQLTLDASGALTAVSQLGNAISNLPAPSGDIAGELKKDGDAAKDFKDALDDLQGALKDIKEGSDGAADALKGMKEQGDSAGGALKGVLSVIPYVKLGVAAFEMGKLAVQGFNAMRDALDPVGAAMRQIQEEQEQAAKQAFLNPKTLEAAQQNLAQIDKQMKELNKEIDAAANTGLPMAGSGEELAGIVQANAALNEQARLLKDKAHLEQARDQLKARSDVLDAEAAARQMTVGKQGLALIQAQYDAQMKLAKAKQAATGDNAQFDRDKKTAEVDKQNATIQLQRQNAEQTIALRHQVMEDALQGTAQIRQIEIDAIEDVDRKQRASLIGPKQAAAQRVLIHQKAAQDIERIQEQAAEETQAMQDQARDAQLQGDDLSYAHQEEQVDKQRALYAKGLIDWDTYQERIRAIDQMTQEEIRKNDERAELERQKKAEETARRKEELLGQQVDAENAAALATMPEWDRANAQIEFDYEKRVRGIDQQEKDLLKQYKDDQDMMVQITGTAQAQREAAWAEANDRIEKEHKRQVEQLGSDLESVFDDITSGKIGERILKNIKKFFFQMVAAFLEATGVMKTIWGQIFGTLFGGPGSSLEQSSGGGLGSILGLFSSSKATAPATSAGTATGASSSNLLAGILGIGPQSTSSGASGWPGVPWALPGGTSAAGSAAGLGASAAGAAGGAVGGGLANVGLGSVNPLGGFEAATGLTLKKSSSSAATAFTKQDGAALAALGLSLGGGLVGGKIGQVGGMIASLGVMALASPGGVAAKLLSHLGMASSTAAIAAAGVGSALMAFGLGSNSGKLAGTLGGAGIGFGTGLALMLAGGPIGWLGALGLAAISALAGLFGGIFGGKKRKRQANAFANDTVLPAVHQIEDQYKNFSLDHASAIGQLEDLRKQAQDNLSKLKGEGRDVMKNVVGPAIDHAEADINGFEAERQRRAALTFGPPEFHTGGFVDTMARSFTSRPGDLLAVLKRGEFVVNPAATAKNRRTLETINSGGSAALSVGEIHIHPATLDRAYVRSGFKQDLLDALSSLRKEGRL